MHEDGARKGGREGGGRGGGTCFLQPPPDLAGVDGVIDDSRYTVAVRRGHRDRQVDLHILLGADLDDCSICDVVWIALGKAASRPGGRGGGRSRSLSRILQIWTKLSAGRSLELIAIEQKDWVSGSAPDPAIGDELDWKSVFETVLIHKLEKESGPSSCISNSFLWKSVAWTYLESLSDYIHRKLLLIVDIIINIYKVYIYYNI
jgi:hypothetical protein